MAMVNFKKGLLASLPSTYAEGTFYVTTDERAIYLDVSNEARIRLGDFQEFANLKALQANTNPSTSALYYVTDINCLAKWNGSGYIQINRDTGMTSVEVTGSGNAVTAAVYDSNGRKLTLTKGATYMTAADVDGKISAKVGDLGESATVKDYVDEKTAGIASDSALKELGARVTTAEGEIDALQADSHTHANKEELDKIAVGDKAKWDAAEGNAKAYADSLAKNYDAAGAAKAVQGETTSTVKAVEDAFNGYKTTNDEAVKAADSKATAAQAAADAKVASVTAGDKSVTVGGTPTAPTVAANLSKDPGNALELAADGLKVTIPAAAEYSIAKDETPGEFAAVYHLTKGGVNTGVAINIPKDMVVQSGSVVTDPEDQPKGTYIKLVLQNVTDPLYINVGDLIEYVTSGSLENDMVVVAVSEDHKVTATITDGTITLAKLHADVQAQINKAHDHANKAVLDGIDAKKVEAWDASEANAKKYADGLNTAMDTRVQAVEADKHTHANKEELDKITAGDKAKWDAAQANAEKTAADALAGAKTELEGKITAAQSAAEKHADGLNTAMDTRVQKLEGIDHDAYKAYADQAETDAVTAAKAYTDGLMAWGAF